MKDPISTRMTDVLPDDGEIQSDESRVEEARQENELSGESAVSPRRYKLYDRFAEQVPLRTVDAVIVITAILIVGLLIYGIVTGNPQ